MAERIEVGYTPAAIVGEAGIYHKYIIYTDADGNQFIARGGPGYFGPGAEDGGRNESSGSPFGNIKTRTGPYTEFTPDGKRNPDWDRARDPTNSDPTATPHPRETIKEGDDLSREWQRITETTGRIDGQDIPYDPRTTNSNSTVDEALREAGLPEATMDGPDMYWAPGSGFDLPGGDTPGESNEQKFYDDFKDWIEKKLTDGIDDIQDRLEALREWLRSLVESDSSSDDQAINKNDQEVVDAFLRQILPLSMSRGDTWESIEAIKRKAQTAGTIPSPIVLDLDGDGVQTVAVGEGAWFDHGADGFAEQTGWVGAGDGLLVRDLDGDGAIDSGRELFGSETLLPDGRRAAHGFEALRSLDGNADGVIDANDAAFAQLQVWRDADGNGRTDAGELLSLTEAGVAGLNLAYTNSSFIDAEGNAHRQMGSYTTTDGLRWLDGGCTNDGMWRAAA